MNQNTQCCEKCLTTSFDAYFICGDVKCICHQPKEEKIEELQTINLPVMSAVEERMYLKINELIRAFNRLNK